MWIIAGPGTGKTEVLVLRCLKLIFVDDVEPGSIIVTTFTNKTARNIEDRILTFYNHLKKKIPKLGLVDITDMRIGTIHSICNEVMQDYKYDNWENIRLLDDIEQKLFIRRERAWQIKNNQTLWDHFFYVLPRKKQGTKKPNLWEAAKASSMIFNFIVNNRIDTKKLLEAGEPYSTLAEEYRNYKKVLANKYRCDFDHLQEIFLKFLFLERGKKFLKGDESKGRPPVKHILVDEYQDTNPIQEEIYFKMAENSPHNLVVVGDDDQALYRFRGGTVESMVTFSKKCESKWNIKAKQLQLKNNYRSHKKLVDWINWYISSFDLMKQKGVRSPNKDALKYSSEIKGDYPSVGWVSSKKYSDLGGEFVNIIQELYNNNILHDYNQCALLLYSTRENSTNAGPFVSALQDANIPYYNPRSKAYLEQEEVIMCLGTLLSIFDPEFKLGEKILDKGIKKRAKEWIKTYTSRSSDYPELQNYVERSKQEIKAKNLNEEITPATPTILYRIFSFHPFSLWQNDPERDLRLSKLTRIFEAYCSLVGRPLFMDNTEKGVVNNKWLSDFYYILIGYLDAVGIDDDEDEEIICPPGRVPIMTIHQAKGLQFKIVFVSSLGHGAYPRGTHNLEEDLKRFKKFSSIYNFPPNEKALHDIARLFYVAYSRAENVLALLGTKGQLSVNNRPAIGGKGFQEFNRMIPRL